MGDSSEDTKSKVEPKEQRVLLNSVEEITEFDKEFWEVTKGLPIRTGSLLKVPASSYHRYGIELNDENRARLKLASEWFYVKDLDEQLELEMLHQTQETEETKQKRDVERKMSWVVGEVVREMMHSLDDGVRRFRVLEVGLRETSATIAGELYRHQETRELLKRVEFHLVDWSPSNLMQARSVLHKMYDLTAEKHEFLDFENFLSQSQDNGFDFIVAVDSFHHKSTADFLYQIRRTLAEDGALVSGDWHSALWHHPYNLYKLLETMGVEVRRLNMLAGLLKDLLKPSPGWMAKPEETQAINEHIDYWLKVQSELKAMGSAGKPRLYMLKAHHTSKEHIENLHLAGFDTDIDKIRAAFPKANLSALPRSVLRGSDFAVVTAGIKKR